MREDLVIDIGRKIRNARIKANISMKALAELSTLSPATIQKIETNHMVPTIISLMKISQALGKKVSFFVEEENGKDRIALIKRKSRKKFYSETSQCRHEYIMGKLEHGLLEGGIFTAKPGGESGKSLNSHSGEEIILCIKGEMEVETPDGNYVLKSGDSLHFKSDILHRWRNSGKSESQIIWVATQLPTEANKY